MSSPTSSHDSWSPRSTRGASVTDAIASVTESCIALEVPALADSVSSAWLFVRELEARFASESSATAEVAAGNARDLWPAE